MSTKKLDNKRLEIVYLPVASLVKLPGNPRKDTDPEAIKKLTGLIKAHGFQNPLQVFPENGKHTILAGNHRFDAGLLLGMTEFPCIVYTGTRKAALARAISDNRSSDWTEWSFPELKDLIVDIDDGSLNLQDTGFSENELSDIFSYTRDFLTYKELELQPYKMSHILLSFPPEKLLQIQEHLEEILKIDGVEYEQSAN